MNEHFIEDQDGKITSEEALYQSIKGLVERDKNFCHYNDYKFLVAQHGEVILNFIPRLKKELPFFEELYKEPKQFEINNYLEFSSRGHIIGVKIHEFSEYIRKKHFIKTIFGKKGETIFYFDWKKYNSDGRALIRSECERLLGIHSNNSRVSEIEGKIKNMSKIDREEFERLDINLIPLNNGVYNLLNKTLLPHLPKYNFRTIVPIDYNEKASCPNFLRFLNEAMYKEDIPAMQEWFGFCLYRVYLIKKGVIIVGDRDKGKSVLLDTLINFVGDENKTGIPLQKISCGSDFTKLALKDKLLNAYDDLSSKDLSDGGGFKVATGGGWISGEEKFGDFIQFKSYAKQIFATNKIPPVKDNDDMAYYSRWIVFRFDNLPEVIDPFLRDKIQTKEEMSGILNWALEGLERLLKNGKFSYNKTPEEVKLIMEMSGNPLVQFMTEVLEEDQKGKVSKEDMFHIYSIWANENKKPKLSKEQLGRQLPNSISYLLDKRDAKERFWAGVKIKENWINKLSESQEVDTIDTLNSNLRAYRDKDKDIIKNNASNLSKFTNEEIKKAGYTSQELEEVIV